MLRTLRNANSPLTLRSLRRITRVCHLWFRMLQELFERKLEPVHGVPVCTHLLMQVYYLKAGGHSMHTLRADSAHMWLTAHCSQLRCWPCQRSKHRLISESVMRVLVTWLLGCYPDNSRGAVGA